MDMTCTFGGVAQFSLRFSKNVLQLNEKQKSYENSMDLEARLRIKSWYYPNIIFDLTKLAHSTAHYFLTEFGCYKNGQKFVNAKATMNIYNDEWCSAKLIPSTYTRWRSINRRRRWRLFKLYVNLLNKIVKFNARDIIGFHLHSQRNWIMPSLPTTPTTKTKQLVRWHRTPSQKSISKFHSKSWIKCDHKNVITRNWIFFLWATTQLLSVELNFVCIDLVMHEKYSNKAAQWIWLSFVLGLSKYKSNFFFPKNGTLIMTGMVIAFK